jgi:hypothetical protein
VRVQGRNESANALPEFGAVTPVDALTFSVSVLVPSLLTITVSVADWSGPSAS